MPSEIKPAGFRADAEFVRAGPTAISLADPSQLQPKSTSSELRIVFIHIPETGGTYAVDYIRRANPTLVIKEVNSPVSDRDLDKISLAGFVHGDIVWSDVARYFKDWRKFTILRDPLSRLYSCVSAARTRNANSMRSSATDDQRESPRWLRQASIDQILGSADLATRKDLVNRYVFQFSGDPVDDTLSTATPSLITSAIANLHTLDFILTTDKIRVDLPSLCHQLGLNTPSEPPIGDQRESGDGQIICKEMTIIWERSLDIVAGDRELYFDVIDQKMGAPYIRRDIRPLVAFVSPIFPDEYGVPVYSLLTIKALSRHARIDLINPTSPPPAETVYLHAHIDAPATKDLDGYDNRVFVLGNNQDLHSLAISLAQSANDGVCIYHDAQMLDTTLHRIGLERTRRLAEQQLGRSVGPDEIMGWLEDRSSLACPLLTPLGDGRFIDVVHSPVQRVVHQTFCPQSQPFYLPHAIQHVMIAEQLSPIGKMAARSFVGIPLERIVIASCGAVNSAKRTTDILFALRHVHDWQTKAHLYFVGTVQENEEAQLRHCAARLGLDEFVHFSGRVDEEQYVQYLAAADVAVQLRYALFGQLSGALIDCIAAGLPTVTPTSLAAALEAPSFVTRVPDSYSSLDVANGLCELISLGRGNVRLEEWSAYAREHSFERYAQRVGYLLGL